MESIAAQLAQDRSERQAVARKNVCTAVGTRALPRDPMDMSGGTTTGDYGAYTVTPQKATSHARRLSATNVGTQTLPRTPMSLSMGTTQGDIGGFYNGVFEPKSPTSPQ